MRKDYYRYALITFALVLVIPFSLTAAQMTGNITYITNKFKVFLLTDEKTGKSEIFSFDSKVGSLKGNDRVKVQYNSAKNAKGIVKTTSVTKLYNDGGISPKNFSKMQADGAVILDVRTAKDAKKGIITNAIHIPLNKLESSLGSLNKSKKTVVYCNSGPIAAIGYNMLKNNGFKNVTYLAAKVKFRKGKLTIN